MVRRIIYASAEEGEAERRLTVARTRGAHAYLESADEIADDPTMDKDDVPRAKLRVDTKMRIAQAWNPQEFGQHKGVQVNVSIGNLHLDALRQTRATAVVSTPAQAQLPAQVVEAEEVS